jgi:multiple sugar transport system substrate-binding protein
MAFRFGHLGSALFTALLVLPLMLTGATNRHVARTPVIVQFWNPAVSAVSKKVIADLVHQFNQTHADIQVKDDSISNANSYAKYTLGLASDNPPDVVLTYDYWPISLWAADRLIQPLDHPIQQYHMTLPAYFPAVYTEVRYHGQMYGLPQEIDEPMLAWNKRLFKEAGLNPNDPPRTIDQLTADAIKLTTFKGGHLAQLGIELDGSYESFYYHTWIYSFGGGLYDKAHQRVTANSAANLRAYTWMANLYPKLGGLEQDAALGNRSSVGDPWQSGTSAMEIMGEWVPSYIPADGPHDPYGVAPLPVAPGVPYGSTFLQPGNDFVLPARARNIEAALTFMKWMSAPQAVYYWCIHEGNLPPAPAMAFSSYFWSHAPNERPFVEAMHHGVTDGIVGTPIATYYINEIQKISQEIFYHQATPKDGLDQLQTTMTAYQQQFSATHPGW